MSNRLPVYFVGRDHPKWAEPLETVNCSTGELLCEAIDKAPKRSMWLTRDPKWLVKQFAKHNIGQRSFDGLLLLKPPEANAVTPLRGWFDRIGGDCSDFRPLPTPQLAQVLSAPEEKRRDVFIGGTVDLDAKRMTLSRGDLSLITVPFSLFPPSGTATPDFRRFRLDDCGQTIVLGNYEASADAILWEVDEDFRRRAKARLREQATGFGASLRRLRIQRGLRQEDFVGINRKTVSRIESGDQTPTDRVRKILAKTLGVSPDSIETY